MFDARFVPSATIPLAGTPSRVQVAPNGSLAGMTVFVTGHSYVDGGFSTRSSLLDLSTGTWPSRTSSHSRSNDGGRPRTAVDFNSWGVTFARDGRTFYAPLGTGGRALLVKGAGGHHKRQRCRPGGRVSLPVAASRSSSARAQA